MAARIGSLYVDLTMNSRGFVSGMDRAAAVTGRAATAINRNVGLSQRTIDAFSRSTGNRSFRPYAIIAASRAYETAADRSNLLRGSLLTLTAVAGGFSAALGTNLISRYADTAINLNNQLRTVTTSTSNLAAVQEQLEAVSQRSRSSLQATGALYARTARASEQLGLSQEKLLRITETIQKAFSIGGATSAEAQGAAIQLSQGIASDRFSGEEFRSVAENAPVLLRGMAESLGVNIGKLREMANAGELTADVVTKAILKASARIEGEFGSTVISMDRAITHVDNKLLEFIANTDKAYGITGLLASGIVSFGDNLDKIIPPLTTVAALVGAVFLARNRGALGGGLGALLGGGAGFALGGLEGAVLGASIGGIGGFGASRKDESGLGFIQRIKADAAAAKANVVELAEAQRDLRASVLESGRAYHKARQAASSDPIAMAPGSDRGAFEREMLQVQKLDEKKLDLLDKQRDAYRRIAAVTAQMSPRAAKFADSQAKAEAKLAESLQQQLTIQRQIAGVGADGRAQGSVEGRPAGVASAAETKQKIALQRELGTVTASIARQQQAIEERSARIAGLATEADRKAAAERLTISRQIMATTQEMNTLDQERTQQAQAAAAARTTAERAGAQVARDSVAQASTTYRGFAAALRETSAQLAVATRAASPLGQAMGFVGRQASSLIGLFGGPWGVAITGAALLFAKFAADAQAQAQKISAAKGLVDEALRETGNGAPVGGQAGSLLASEIANIETNIKALEEGASAAEIKLEELFNGFEKARGAQVLVNAFGAIANLPIQGKINELRTLTEQFLAGEADVTTFRAGIEELNNEVNNPAFENISGQVLALANILAAKGFVVDTFKQKIIDLQEVASDPINLLITTTFDQIDAAAIDAPLQNAVNQFAGGLGFTRGLEGELETLRLIGDARKKAEYTDEQVKKAEKDGVVITDAIRSRISAFVDEKIALENRDAAIKKSAKDDPFERAVASIREKTEALRTETQLVGSTTYAIERARVAQELESAAKEARMALTPALYDAILLEADAYAQVAQASEDLEKRRQAETEQLNFYKSTFSSFFVDIKNDLLEGASLWDAFANAGANALNKIADRALGLAADGIFDMIFGALTGGIGGGIGSIFGGGGKGFIPTITGPSLFAAGGFTGPGGKYQPAGIVHAGEYVFDAASVKRIGVGALDAMRMRGYAEGGYVSPSMPRMPTLANAANSNAVNDNGININLNTYINAQGSTMTEAQFKAILNERDRAMRDQLPAMVKKIQSQPRRTFV